MTLRAYTDNLEDGKRTQMESWTDCCRDGTARFDRSDILRQSHGRAMTRWKLRNQTQRVAGKRATRNRSKGFFGASTRYDKVQQGGFYLSA